MKASERFPPGSLAVVSVSLGNPADITPRALETLGAADLVAAEDTRTAGRLLSHHGLATPTLSYHDWNEEQRAEELVRRLSSGTRIALVAEAGTPGISDPGFDLVRLARQRGLHVFPVPGPSALTAFLSASGLPTDAFTFLGFTPRSRRTRRTRFRELAERTETLVFYESPHRVVGALEDALEVFGERECALAREMTKAHEEFLFGPLSQILESLRARPRVRGEVCWGIRGISRRNSAGAKPDLDRVLREVAEEDLPPRQAARAIARRCGISAKEAYAALLARKRAPGA